MFLLYETAYIIESRIFYDTLRKQGKPCLIELQHSVFCSKPFSLSVLLMYIKTQAKYLSKLDASPNDLFSLILRIKYNIFSLKVNYIEK